MKMTRLEKLTIRVPLRAFFQRKFEAPKVFSGLTVNRNCTALEIGSGQGIGALLANEHLDCKRIACVDVDLEMIESAKKFVLHPPGWATKIRKDNIEFLLADAANLPFPDSFFDAVFFFWVLHHTVEWRKVLSEIHRVLKPGGILSFEETLLPDSFAWLDKFLGHIPFRRLELEEALWQAGFSIERLERMKHLPVCFVRALK